MDTVLTPEMLSHTPKAAAADWTPSAKGNFGFEGGWSESGFSNDMDADMQAANATAAAYHADVAAKHAASTANHATVLAQWVSYLWQQQSTLQSKVNELEEWKKKTLEDMRKLREEHKALRKKYGGEEEQQGDRILRKAASASSAVSPTTPETPSVMAGPPGLELAAASCSAEAAGEDSFIPAMTGLTRTETAVYVTDTQNEGVTVNSTSLDGDDAHRAEWRIGHLSVKLRGCMGRALVSPPFAAWGMEDCRLMLFPDHQNPQGPRSRRAKEQYQKKVSDGPLEGCIKLKVPSCPAPHILKYYLTIGNSLENRKGPYTHNFAECTVSEPVEFGTDWLLMCDGDGGFNVSVDIIKVE